MIDNNIIQSLNAGSGIDSRNIVKQLTEIERAAPQERIDKKTEQAETQISDFGLMASAMDTLKSAVAVLSDEEGMYSKTGSISDTTSLQVTADPDAQTGSYSLQVQSLAQAHTVAFEDFDDPNDSVGEGTLTFNFGTWDRDLDTFSSNPEASSVEITIDSSNNSLTGLKNAINEADMGVQASIIDVGGSYRLVLTAESGVENELYIEASDTGDGDNFDESGLSRFAFNENLTGTRTYSDLETQEGIDAVLSINGLSVSRSTNSIDDAIPGLTFDLLQVDLTEKVSLTISDDKAYAETNVRNFVDAYNAFLEEIDPLFSFDEEEEKWGSLTNDSLAKSVISQLRNTIASVVPGISDGNYTALTNVGIRTELDGTLSINEDDFATAFSDNFEDVQQLFSPNTTASASYIDVHSYGKNSTPGEYDVIITQAPAKGKVTGGVEASPTLDATARSYEFVLTLNGTASDTITIDTSQAFDSTTDLTAALQSAINADENLVAAGSSIVVSYDTDTSQFVFTSNKYGTSSTVKFSDMSQDFMDDFGLDSDVDDIDTDAGKNVKGTIDGEQGFGFGNVLRPALGSDAEGLSMIVSENATISETSQISFARGFAGEFEEVLDTFLQTNGLFDQREDVLNRRLSSLEDDQDSLDRRMSAYEERLLRQFIAMENILNGLNSQGGFLENLTKTLPFTSGND